jgi:hypothetical protein
MHCQEIIKPNCGFIAAVCNIDPTISFTFHYLPPLLENWQKQPKFIDQTN